MQKCNLCRVPELNRLRKKMCNTENGAMHIVDTQIILLTTVMKNKYGTEKIFALYYNYFLSSGRI